MAVVTWQPLPVIASGIDQITLAGQRQILAAPAAPSVGSIAADVIIVEYFDYNCPYCKRLVPTFQSLLASDHGVAIMYKDWPVLSAVSLYAARCALAAKWQDQYFAAHDALLKGPRLARNEDVDQVLRGAGIDMTRLKTDLQRHAGTIDALLLRNDTEARALELSGTPGVLVGRQLVGGIADLPTLQKLLAAARKP